MSVTFANRNKIVGATYDQALLWVTLILLAFGLVMVYSASIASAEVKEATNHQSTYFLLRQSIFVVVGLVFGLAAFQVPTSVWQRLAPVLFMLGLLMLLLVLIPGIGHKVLGS